MKSNERLRKRLEADIARFFESGGEVQVIQTGLSGERARAEKADSSRLRWTKDTKHKTAFTRDNGVKGSDHV